MKFIKGQKEGLRRKKKQKRKKEINRLKDRKKIIQQSMQSFNYQTKSLTLGAIWIKQIFVGNIFWASLQKFFFFFLTKSVNVEVLNKSPLWHHHLFVRSHIFSIQRVPKRERKTTVVYKGLIQIVRKCEITFVQIIFVLRMV